MASGSGVLSRAKGAAILESLITDEQLAVYGALLDAARRAELRVAMGGGLASSAYSGYVRNTKDMDLYLVEPDQEKLMEIMAGQGFTEYTEFSYDPTWSYRGSRGDHVVDLLWRMLNGRGSVDEVWTSQGWDLEVKGVQFRLIPPEELLWSKLYILRRERTDWPDILNVLFAQGPALDWQRLLNHVAEDAEVLASVMSLFRWMCPGRAADLPGWIWGELGLGKMGTGAPAVDRTRTGLFKGDDWFTAEVS